MDEAIDTPSNIKHILDEQIIDLRRKNKTIRKLKLSFFIHNKIFLYDLDSIIKKTALDRNVLIYGSITYLGEKQVMMKLI